MAPNISHIAITYSSFYGNILSLCHGNQSHTIHGPCSSRSSSAPPTPSPHLRKRPFLIISPPAPWCTIFSSYDPNSLPASTSHFNPQKFPTRGYNRSLLSSKAPRLCLTLPGHQE